MLIYWRVPSYKLRMWKTHLHCEDSIGGATHEQCRNAAIEGPGFTKLRWGLKRHQGTNFDVVGLIFSQLNFMVFNQNI